MKILFASFSGLRFDVATPEREPLGGSESCIAYLATTLAGSNEVCLLANTERKVLRAVRHIDFKDTVGRASFFENERFDVIVLVNMPAAAPNFRRLSPHSKIVLWNHHAPDQPAVESMMYAQIVRSLDCVVYVSEWQRKQTQAKFNTPVRSEVIGNGLTPSFESQFGDRQEFLATKELRAAYTSTPFRGLDILLEAHSRLTTPIDLDVFSSMRVYGGDDGPYQALYQRAQSSPHVHYHGAVSQAQLVTALRRVSFLTYPCTFAETFCIAALEAMAVGATVVTTDMGALSSTTMGYGELMPAEDASPAPSAARFAVFLEERIARAQHSREQWAERMLEQITVVNRECTWRRRAVEWQALLAQVVGRE
jgi:glycosyltransferase involved in cell wall biosynthesis